MASNPLLAFPGMDQHLETVNERLLASVTTEDPYLTELTTHLIRAGGKRLRPLFAVASAATGAEVTLDVVDGGVAVELVQVGSLYHDDVIDEAETRRGVDSVNIRWGNLKAILAGDFLLAKASEIAARLGTEVAGLLAATIGRLCEGEILELRNLFNADRTEADYFSAIDGKTASLYATACRIGGIVGGLPRPHIESLTEFGHCYGMAFQVVDDVLDLVATDEQLGKPAGLDLTEGVYNLPVLRALQTDAGDELREMLGRPIEGDARDHVKRLVRDSGGVDSALEAAASYVQRAVTALDAVADNDATTAMAGGARHLVESVEAIIATN